LAAKYVVNQSQSPQQQSMLTQQTCHLGITICFLFLVLTFPVRPLPHPPFLQCYFAFVEDGTACNDGANTCEGGSCSGASSYISRRSVGTKPSIGVDEGKVVIHAIDTVFAVPEQRVGDEIIPASSFSMVDFKASIDTVRISLLRGLVDS
jgi:hypothetical protein